MTRATRATPPNADAAIRPTPAEGDAVHATPPAIPSPIGARPVVLVVHGDLDSRVGYAQSFERGGCIAVLADGINEALTCLSRPWMEFDAAWIALDLPDGRGETVLAILKNTPRFHRVRAVAHIGLDVGGHRAAGLAGYGAAGWVSGPADFSLVWAAVFPMA